MWLCAHPQRSSLHSAENTTSDLTPAYQTSIYSIHRAEKLAKLFRNFRGGLLLLVWFFFFLWEYRRSYISWTLERASQKLITVWIWAEACFVLLCYGDNKLAVQTKSGFRLLNVVFGSPLPQSICTRHATVLKKYKSGQTYIPSSIRQELKLQAFSSAKELVLGKKQTNKKTNKNM